MKFHFFLVANNVTNPLKNGQFYASILQMNTARTINAIFALKFSKVDLIFVRINLLIKMSERLFVANIQCVNVGTPLKRIYGGMLWIIMKMDVLNVQLVRILYIILITLIAHFSTISDHLILSDADGCDVRLNSRASKGRHIKTCHGTSKDLSKNSIANSPTNDALKKSKKPRKDIGLPKLSVAAELSGLGFQAKSSRTIIENSGKTELSKEELVKDICDNKDVKLLLEEFRPETEPENDIICSDVEKDDPEMLIFPRRVQNILETDDDITDLEETPTISVIKGKEEVCSTSSTKRYDFSYFLS